jgi:hypothetical protein
MSRNASGTYSLPAGNPVVTGTSISTTWANTTLPDLAAEMTDSLSRSGKGGMTAVFKGVDGAVGGPALSFSSEATSGLFRNAAGDIQMSVLGVKVFAWKDRLEAFSKLAAGDAGTDFLIQSTTTRTAGDLFKVSNNGTEKFRVAFDGTIYQNGSVLGVGGYAAVFLAADQTKTGVASDITGFSIAATAGTYIVRITAIVSSGDAANFGLGIRMKSAGAPTTSSILLDCFYDPSGGAMQSAQATAADADVPNANLDAGTHLQLIVVRVVATGSGTIAFQGRRTGGTADPVLRSGSTMEWKKVA